MALYFSNFSGLISIGLSLSFLLRLIYIFFLLIALDLELVDFMGAFALA